MKTTEFSISHTVHDIKNYIAGAISHLQLSAMENDELETDANIAASVNSLWLALKLARELAVEADTNTSSPTNNTSLNYVLMSVNEHVSINTKPFIENLRKSYPETKINDNYVEKKEEKYVEVNAKSYNQAIGNIVGNAVNAGASIIDIHAVMRAYCLVITIHDNGSGMSSEDVDKILLSQFGDGTVNGIGTKSVLKTAAEHDFPLTYTSVEGEGTTVKILMPYMNP